MNFNVQSVDKSPHVLVSYKGRVERRLSAYCSANGVLQAHGDSLLNTQFDVVKPLCRGKPGPDVERMRLHRFTPSLASRVRVIERLVVSVEKFTRRKNLLRGYARDLPADEIPVVDRMLAFYAPSVKRLRLSSTSRRVFVNLPPCPGLQHLVLEKCSPYGALTFPCLQTLDVRDWSLFRIEEMVPFLERTVAPTLDAFSFVVGWTSNTRDWLRAPLMRLVNRLAPRVLRLCESLLDVRETDALRGYAAHRTTQVLWLQECSLVHLCRLAVPAVAAVSYYPSAQVAYRSVKWARSLSSALVGEESAPVLRKLRLVDVFEFSDHRLTRVQHLDRRTLTYYAFTQLSLPEYGLLSHLSIDSLFSDYDKLFLFLGAAARLPLTHLCLNAYSGDGAPRDDRQEFFQRMFDLLGTFTSLTHLLFRFREHAVPGELFWPLLDRLPQLQVVSLPHVLLPQLMQRLADGRLTNSIREFAVHFYCGNYNCGECSSLNELDDEPDRECFVSPAFEALLQQRGVQLTPEQPGYFDKEHTEALEEPLTLSPDKHCADWRVFNQFSV